MKNKKRLDAYVVETKKCSKTLASKMISQGLIKINNEKITKSGYLIKENDVIEITEIQKKHEIKKEIVSIHEWKKDIPIVYQDDYIYIVNKPSGMITHPTNYETTNTLVNALKYLKKTDENIFEIPFRYGILHRLDKDTSGLLMVANDQKSFNEFSKLIGEKQITRKYLALIEGKLKTKVVEVQAAIKRINDTSKMEVSNDFDAKDAITVFTTIREYKSFSLVSCELKTGRTHQIRVHARYINNPVVNDPLYGYGKATKYGQFLVANELSFFHPFLKKQINIKIDIPKEFNEYIKKHGKN